MNIRAMLTGGIQRLAHADRYSTYHVNRDENVAEHTAFVSLYCMLIGKSLEKHDVGINWEKLLQSALLHDIDEALTGDFLRSVKYKTPGLKKLLDDAAASAVESMENELEVESLFRTWKECKDQSLEGSILQVADFLGVASYVIGEYYSGNRHLMHVFNELGELLEELKDELVYYGKSGKLLAEYITDCLSVMREVLLNEAPINSEYGNETRMPLQPVNE